MKSRITHFSARQRGGALFKLFVFLVILVALAGAAWVVMLPSLIVSTIHSKTGFVVKIEHLSANPIFGTAHVTGLVLQNPDGWPETGFVEVREFKADVRILPLLGGKFVANDVVADIAQVTLVRNQKGILNSTAFASGFSSPPAAPQNAPASSSPPAASKSPEFMIHHLLLKFDNLAYADYSGARPVTRKYAINLRSEMTEVDSVAKLLAPLSGSALAVMANAFGGLSPKQADLLNSAVNLLQGSGQKAQDSLKNLFQSLDKKKP
ncbi:MAG TPA: hypothetical protein VHD32_03975 [Candidatus Didemnitutus sp.]|nr:hypothetical protein [Candidatus Didemnitutus sp.]